MHLDDISKTKTDVDTLILEASELRESKPHLVRNCEQAVPMVEGDGDKGPAQGTHRPPPQEGGPHGLLQIYSKVVWPIKLHCNLHDIFISVSGNG